ncbi:Retinal guanylyl cyclase 1 [Sparganum proliferum]
MTQVLLEYGNGSIPENTNFFQPLAEPLIRVPSLPGITFSIGRKGGSFFDYYDFYFFGIRHEFLFNTSRNVTTARWDEIYQLEALILEGTNTVQEVIRKQWPGNGSGPSVNYCMLVVCENGRGPHLLTLLLKLAGDENHVRGPTMTAEAAQAFRQEILFPVVVQTVEKDASEDPPGDVQQGDASVVVAERKITFALVEVDDCGVHEILRDLSLTSHLLEERHLMIHELGATVSVDPSFDRV